MNEAGTRRGEKMNNTRHNLRGRDRFMTRRAAIVWAFAVTLSLGCATAWSASSDDRPLPSPSTFVPCGAETPCEPGYWAFRAPDCQYHGVPHPPGSVLLLESGTKLQCGCRLASLLTKPDAPPRARVSCAWIDLDAVKKEH